MAGVQCSNWDRRPLLDAQVVCPILRKRMRERERDRGREGERQRERESMGVLTLNTQPTTPNPKL
jgi:hypothetical protein